MFGRKRSPELESAVAAAGGLGCEVLGWSDEPDRKQISLSLRGASLDDAKRELARCGWRFAPSEPTAGDDGNIQDFRFGGGWPDPSKGIEENTIPSCLRACRIVFSLWGVIVLVGAVLVNRQALLHSGSPGAALSRLLSDSWWWLILPSLMSGLPLLGARRTRVDADGIRYLGSSTFYRERFVPMMQIVQVRTEIIRNQRGATRCSLVLVLRDDGTVRLPIFQPMAARDFIQKRVGIPSRKNE